MLDNNYQNLIDKNKYQVFLLKSRCTFPFQLFVHTWFVLNNKGVVSRWEIWESDKNNKVEHWGHLYKNQFSPFNGVRTIYLSDDFLTNKTVLIEKVEGEEALKMISLIENLPLNYPFNNKYKYLGPNSNTYTQWVINKFPELNIQLPWNAFGKNYDK